METTSFCPVEINLNLNYGSNNDFDTCEDSPEVPGSTITVAEGAIWRSLRLAAMSSVSRILWGKAVAREKLVNLLARPSLKKVGISIMKRQ